MTVGIAERDACHAAGAAVRLAGVAGGLSARVADRVAVLEGEDSAETLVRRWRIALLNERLLADARVGRDALLTELVA